ncbi:MAG: UDP-3-O-acylglucosamine N-acyltransferase [Candidatus Anoxychlamydiales bacterium]|nr:UDP-3-O-acylglucosamine N-acyltransferase [Candidatus Anoxychlamydiales bacterium]NGX36269.1 UDP-3-O-acylglucosamine N-acyltransferase [Candidatus Anoxychlamydiales bacterium]
MIKATLKKLANLTSCKLLGDENIEISGVNTLEKASFKEASFLANPRYIDSLNDSKAGVICVSKNIQVDKTKNYLISEDPSNAFQKIAQFFLSNVDKKTSGFISIHESSVIHETAKIGKNVTILPNSVIDKDVKIDDNTFIGANVYIGARSSIGKECVIHSNVSIREGCSIKDRVILQPGVVIGSCGFGYLFTKENKYEKLAQIGSVIIEDDVEIGANTCIDRARFKDTIIKKGVKIDNLVQIAHNVEIGDHTAIAAQTGIAGSSKIGRYVVMGGQVGVTGHVKIADGSKFATRSGISKSLAKDNYRGSPAININQYNRQYITFKRLEKTLQALEDKIHALEEKSKNL